MPDPLDLSRAVELLERCSDELVYDEFDDPAQLQLEHDVKCFLSSIRAEATADLCYEGDCAKMTGRARPCPVHDAQPPLPTRAEPDGWHVEGAKAWQQNGAWRTEVNLSDTGNIGVGFTYAPRDHSMGGSIPVAVLQRLLTTPRAELTGEGLALSEIGDAIGDAWSGKCSCEAAVSHIRDLLVARRAARKESKP